MSAGQAIAIIPARLASSRFPQKVLASETGLPLVVHAARAAAAAGSVGRVVIAADDQQIVEAAQPHGIECVLTSPDHPNGTSRLAEAAQVLGLAGDAVVVNVQGDEPEMEPEPIDAAVRMLLASGCPVATVATPLDEGLLSDPNIVKVVLDRAGRAMYFSRSPIPHDRDGSDRTGGLRHLGLYVYRRSFLDAYRSLEPTPLEELERLEQLRVLEHGHSIAVAVIDRPSPPGIDTPEQYAEFVARWRGANPPKSGT